MEPSGGSTRLKETYWALTRQTEMRTNKIYSKSACLLKINIVLKPASKFFF